MSSLIPTSLPLAVLLASLITFGNMGEDLELLSMKAAGVSLLRVMRPVMLTAMLITGLSFYVQNKTAPEATISMRTLLISMKQASPAVEIPEGVFYNGVPNVNIYVQKKDVETGMLYQLIIYKTDQGFDRAQIVLADSGRLEMAADKCQQTHREKSQALDLWIARFNTEHPPVTSDELARLFAAETDRKALRERIAGCRGRKQCAQHEPRAPGVS